MSLRLRSFRPLFGALVLFVALLSGLRAAPIDGAAVDRHLAALEAVTAQIEEMESEFGDMGDLERYEAEFRAVLDGRRGQPMTEEKLRERLAASRLVLASDVHTAWDSQSRTLKALESMLSGPGPVTLVIEWIDRSFQAEVDAYLAGDTTLAALRKAVRYDELWGFPWKSYSRILKLARKRKVPVLLVDRFIEHHSLAERDTMITETLAAHAEAHPGMRHLLVYGAYHLLGTRHLRQRLVKKGLVPDAVLLDEAGPFYWEALRRLGDTDHVAVLDLGDGLFFERSGSPLERQIAYREYLMGVTGFEEEDFDLPLDEILSSLGDRELLFRHLHGPVN